MSVRCFVSAVSTIHVVTVCTKFADSAGYWKITERKHLNTLYSLDVFLFF